jgi:hypothetical protein
LRIICLYARVNQFHQNQNCQVHPNIAKCANIIIGKSGNSHSICKLLYEEMHKEKA